MGIKNISDKIRVSKDRIFYNINMRDIDYIRAYNSETQIFAKGETFSSALYIPSIVGAISLAII